MLHYRFRRIAVLHRLSFSGFVMLISVAIWTVGTAQSQGGGRLYADNCQSCHGPNGRGGKAPDLVPFRRTYEETLHLVRHPECEMREFSESELSDKDVQEIVDYLKTLK
jgi:mono/diheme cytochrome c family protein